jgi:hypothetical protein
MLCIQVFEGIPPPYDKKKRMVVPEALRVTRLRPGRRFTNLGRMCSEVGWKHWDTIKTLEAKRKTKSSAFWAKKKEVIQVLQMFLISSLPFISFLICLFVQLRRKVAKQAASDPKVQKAQKILDIIEKPAPVY